MPRPPKTWKAAERAVARLLEGRRCHFEGWDVDAPGWAVEVKHGRQVSRTLLVWWRQAQGNAQDGKRPLLVLHPRGADYRDSLAVLRLEDLAELERERLKPVKVSAPGTTNDHQGTVPLELPGGSNPCNRY